MFKTFFLAFTLGLSFISSAKVVEGITVPDSIKIKESNLLLNGAGIRRATFLNVKVYVGALYLSKKVSNVEAVLNAPYPKYLSMTFLRDADGESLLEEWQKGFSVAVPEKQRVDLKDSIQKFYKLMGDIKKKQQILLSFFKNGVVVSVNGKVSEKIGNEDFSKALLSIWFINARDKSLKEELLGRD